jgi:AcrR family transcriptional regulator
MARSRPTPEPVAPSPTRERLLEEAIHAIERGGEAAVNVREVAAACGVTSPIIYKGFGSRDGLIVAAQAERFRRVIDAIAAPFVAAVESATTVDELRAIVELLLAATHDPSRAGFRRIQFDVMGASVHRPALRSAVDDALQALVQRSAAALEVARTRGLVRGDLALPEMVWWFFGQVQGRFLVEQSTAVIDSEAWNRSSREAVLTLLFGG